MGNSKEQDQSLKNKNSDKVEEAPKIGLEEREDYGMDLQQQGGQTMPPRGLDEQYNLEDYYRKDDTEVAQELAVNDFNQSKTSDSNERKNKTNTEVRNDTEAGAKTGIGWIAVILSVLAFFMMPILLGAIGIILGFVARNRGVTTLGNTAIAAGAVAIAIRLLIMPFV